MYLPQEFRRHAVGVEMRRYGGMEDWRLATGVATWRNGGKYELATGVVPEVLTGVKLCSSKQ